MVEQWFSNKDWKEMYEKLIEKYYVNNDVDITKSAYIKTYTDEDAMKKEIITNITHYNDDEHTYLNYAFNGDFIEKVIFNDPATIIIWKDGTKTVVKCGEDDVYNPEFGMAMAICKKVLGNKGNYYNVFSNWLPEEVMAPSPVAIALSKIAEAFKKGKVEKETGFDQVPEEIKKDLITEESKKYLNRLYGTAGEGCLVPEIFEEDKVEEIECTEYGCPIPVIPAEEKTHPVINLENGYAPHYDTNPKKNDDDEWIEIKPEDHLGDNSYERWKVNTPFHEKIKERRKALGYSHKDMGAKVGCPQSNFSFWERGRWYPKSEKVRQKLAEVLNFQLDELYEVTEVNGEIQTTIREEKKK